MRRISAGSCLCLNRTAGRRNRPIVKITVTNEDRVWVKDYTGGGDEIHENYMRRAAVFQLRVQPAAEMMISLSLRRCCADGIRLSKAGKLCNAGAVQLLR